MMRWLALVAGALASALACGMADARVVTDSAGRRVEIPDHVTRVFTAGPPASTLVYVVAPQDLIGWMKVPSEQEKAFLLPAVRDLPELGRLTGRGDTTNLEAVVAAKPDFILDVGTINDTYKSLADRVQAQTGIPYLLLDGSLAKTSATFRLLGDILGAHDRGEALAAASDAIFARTDAILSRVPATGRPRVYLARTPSGLQTGTRGSINTEIIERAGATNVVEGIAGRPGLVAVSLEQIITWSPQTIVSVEPGFRATALGDSAWTDIPAVQSGRVFVAPAAPFGWIDSPPSVNRLVGLTWLLHMLYPDQAGGDLRADVRDFYRLFYQIELDDPGLDRLLDAN